MALSFEDKILGEKLDYYCSSSSDESDSDLKFVKANDEPSSSRTRSKFYRKQPATTNTGPKGVIEDWRSYKKLENEQRTESELEKAKLAEKLSLTCRSHLNDHQKNDNQPESDDDLLDSLQDAFLLEYQKRRLAEMHNTINNLPVFGKLLYVSCSDEFIKFIDDEHPKANIIVHIYEKNAPGCEAMDGCLKCLATEYPHVKFGSAAASDVCMSRKFQKKGVPALLVYKNKELIGNYVSLVEELTDDFFASDVESLLQGYGILPCFESHALRENDDKSRDSGSDFELD